MNQSKPGLSELYLAGDGEAQKIRILSPKRLHLVFITHLLHNFMRDVLQENLEIKNEKRSRELFSYFTTFHVVY